MNTSRALLKKAKETLTSVEILFEAGRNTDAVARAYYAMYHAAQALLLAHDIDASTHKGVRLMFGKHFVKTGKIDAPFATSFREAFDARLLADYSGESISREPACQTMEDAQAFIAEIERFLNKEGL